MKHIRWLESEAGLKRLRSWLKVLSVVALMLFALRLRGVVLEVNAALFQAQWDEKVHTLDLLCDEVDRYVSEDGDWSRFDYLRDLRREAIELDRWRGLSAALYDEELETLSTRVCDPDEVMLYPMSDIGVSEAATKTDRGQLRVMYSGVQGKGEAVWVYFRWIPTGKYSNKVCFMIAMREQPLDEAPSMRLALWSAALILTTGFILLVAGVADAVRPKEAVVSCGPGLSSAGHSGADGRRRSFGKSPEHARADHS